MLIAISGIDGSGKTTLAKAVSARLGCPMISFPDRTTATGKEISAMLKGEIPHSPMAFQTLQVCNRLEHLAELSHAVCRAKEHLVCDRYVADGLVYGTLDGLFYNDVARIQQGLPRPDVAVLLNTPANVAYDRLRARGNAKLERYEVAGLVALQTQAARFLVLWEGRVHARDPRTTWLQINPGEEPVENLAAKLIAEMNL